MSRVLYISGSHTIYCESDNTNIILSIPLLQQNPSTVTVTVSEHILLVLQEITELYKQCWAQQVQERMYSPMDDKQWENYITYMCILALSTLLPHEDTKC